MPDSRVAGRFRLQSEKLMFMLTESCLNENTPAPCEKHDFMSHMTWIVNEKPIHIANNTHQWNVGRRISDLVIRDTLPLVDQADLFLRELDDNGDEWIKIPRKVVKVWIYCGPCCCLIRTAFIICGSRGMSRHVEIAIRVDYRLKTSCCSSSVMGLVRVKALLIGSEEVERKWVNFEDHLDRPWIEKIILAAENRQGGPLGQAETSKSQQDLFREYSNEHENDKSSAMSFIIGEADYLASLMDCFNCIFNPNFPTVGEMWQVFLEKNNEGIWQWNRSCRERYTLSVAANKQREELSHLRRSSRSLADNTTKSMNELFGPMSNLASPPPSVSSKRQRSPSSTPSDTRENRAMTDPASEHSKGVRVADSSSMT